MFIKNKIMSRPRSANQGPKKISLINKMQDQFKVIIPPESLPNIQKKQQSNINLFDDEMNEEFNLIKNQWDDLGITLEYRSIFINLLKKVNESERKDIFIQEKLNLKKFRDALFNLKKEINNRDNNISLLRQLDKNLENCINLGDEKSAIDDILKEVINIIKTLRLNAVNIVARIIKVNQLSTYYSNSGKFDTNKIKPEYSYDPKYLFKMKEDLLFLKNSTISDYIEMNNTEIDAFLTNCAPNKNKNEDNKKIIIPISDDVMKLIVESRYALIQETVLTTVERDEGFTINRKIDFNEGKKYRRGASANKFRSIEEEKFKFNQNRPFGMNNKINNIKKNNNYFKNKNFSRYLHNIKNVNSPTSYNKLFFKNSPGRTTKLRIGKKRIFNLNSPNNINYYNNIYTNPKKIIIEHEVVQSLTNEEFMKKLGSYQNSNDISPTKNNNYSNINQQDKIINNEEIENIKIENKNY